MVNQVVDLISPQYGLVLAVSAILGFQVVLFGFIFPGRLRKTVFSQDFMEKNFSKQHNNEVKSKVPKGGYPDMGDGRYSEKLAYKDWYLFNCAQRAHINFVESIATYLILLLVAGLYNPLVTAGLGVALIVGRIIYGIGYVVSPALRLPGALIIDAALLALVGLAGCASWSIVKRGKWF